MMFTLISITSIIYVYNFNNSDKWWCEGVKFVIASKEISIKISDDNSYSRKMLFHTN